MYVCMYVCACVCYTTYMCTYVHTHAYKHMPKAFLFFLFCHPHDVLLLQGAGQAVLGQWSELCLVEH